MRVSARFPVIAFVNRPPSADAVSEQSLQSLPPETVICSIFPSKHIPCGVLSIPSIRLIPTPAVLKMGGRPADNIQHNGSIADLSPTAAEETHNRENSV